MPVLPEFRRAAPCLRELLYAKFAGMDVKTRLGNVKFCKETSKQIGC